LRARAPVLDRERRAGPPQPSPCVIAYLALGSSASSNTAATRTSTVLRGVVLTSVSASGAVQSSDDVSASFPTSGTLSAVLVSAGQHVAKGQVLARIQSLSARQALQEAQANLTTAQGRLQQTLSPLNTAGAAAARGLERVRRSERHDRRDVGSPTRRHRTRST